MRLGRHDEAVTQLVRAEAAATRVDGRPTAQTAVAWYLLALTCRSTGDKAEAQRWFQKAEDWRAESHLAQNDNSWAWTHNARHCTFYNAKRRRAHHKSLE